MHHSTTAGSDIHAVHDKFLCVSECVCVDAYTMVHICVCVCACASVMMMQVYSRE